MDKYIQLDLQLPSKRIFGLGERKSNFLLGEGAWTMWANGAEPKFDNGGQGTGNSFGVHPFALVQTKNQDEYFGLFFRNTDAQTVVINYKTNGETTLSYITTGGSIEIYVMLRGTAKEIIQQYQQIIGLPNLPPLWALGMHLQSRSYKQQSDVEAALKSYEDGGFPIEAIYLDVPYMSSGKDFTVDTKAFPSLSTFADTLHGKNQKLVARLDMGIDASDKANPYYTEAQQGDALIKSKLTDKELTNKLFTSDSVYLDFFNTKAVDVWGKGLQDLYDKAFKFDGIWLESNQVYAACDGECKGAQVADKVDKIVDSFLQDSDSTDNGWYQSFKNQDQISTFNLPFIPGNQNLDKNTLSLNATHP